MYSLGSVEAVGSWFFISVTRRVRKSLLEMVDGSDVLSAGDATGDAAIGLVAVVD
jgi:hypothetical protein